MQSSVVAKMHIAPTLFWNSKEFLNLQWPQYSPNMLPTNGPVSVLYLNKCITTSSQPSSSLPHCDPLGSSVPCGSRPGGGNHHQCPVTNVWQYWNVISNIWSYKQRRSHVFISPDRVISIRPWDRGSFSISYFSRLFQVFKVQVMSRITEIRKSQLKLQKSNNSILYINYNI
jgi:hypothetical protein